LKYIEVYAAEIYNKHVNYKHNEKIIFGNLDKLGKPPSPPQKKRYPFATKM